MGSLSLLQGIVLTQGLNPGLPHCRRILYQLSHKGRPRIMEWVAYPFSSGSSQRRNRTGVSCIAGRFFTSWAVSEDQEYIAPSNTLYQPASVMEGQWNKEQGKENGFAGGRGNEWSGGKGVETQRGPHREDKVSRILLSLSTIQTQCTHTRTHTHTHTHTHPCVREKVRGVRNEICPTVAVTQPQ